MKKDKKLTTNAGAPVVDNQNIMTAGPQEPVLLQDVWFLEKLAHFDREVIPERRMRAKGSGPTAPLQSPMTSPAIPRQKYSLKSEIRLNSSPAFPRWPESAGPLTPSGCRIHSP